MRNKKTVIEFVDEELAAVNVKPIDILKGTTIDGSNIINYLYVRGLETDQKFPVKPITEYIYSEANKQKQKHIEKLAKLYIPSNICISDILCPTGDAQQKAYIDAVMTQFIWQVKRKMLNDASKPVSNHIFPILVGVQNDCEFMHNILNAFESYLKSSNMLANVAINNKNYIVFSNDLGLDEVKRVMPIVSSEFVTIQGKKVTNLMSFIGATPVELDLYKITQDPCFVQIKVPEDKLPDFNYVEWIASVDVNAESAVAKHTQYLKNNAIAKAANSLELFLAENKYEKENVGVLFRHYTNFCKEKGLAKKEIIPNMTKFGNNISAYGVKKRTKLGVQITIKSDKIDVLRKNAQSPYFNDNCVPLNDDAIAANDG